MGFRTTLHWACPHCGHANTEQREVQQYGTNKLTRCSIDDGGCDRLIVLAVDVQIVATPLTVNDPC